MPRRAQLRRPAALSWCCALATVPPVLALACNWDRPSGPRVAARPPRPTVGFVGSAFYSLGGAGAAYLRTGDTATLRASAYSPSWPETLVYDSYRSEAEARRFRWTSSDTTVATIGPTGLVTARAAGSTVVGAFLDGVEGGGGPLLTVYPPAASIAVEPVGGRLNVEVGEILSFRVLARDAAGVPLAGVPITLYSSDDRAASPIPNITMTPSPGVQTFGAWRAGTITLLATTPHVRPGGRVTSDVTLTITDPGVAPDSLPHGTADPVLRASASRTTLASGDTTTVRLTLFNRGNAPIRFTASASCALLFTVVEGGGTIAWPFGPRDCNVPRRFVIPPGDSLVREMVWRADDGRAPVATPLVPGFYWIFPAVNGDGFFAVGETLMIRVLP